MSDQYFLAALLAFQAPFLCLIICSYIFAAMGRNGVSRHQQALVKGMSVICLGAVVMEIIAYAMNSGIIAPNDSGIAWITAIGYLFMLLYAAFWSEFCLSRCNEPPKMVRGILREMCVVVFALLVLRIICRNTDLFLYYENGVMHFGRFNDVQSIGCVVIYLVLFIMLFVKIRDKSEFAHREAHIKLATATAITLIFLTVFVVTSIPYTAWMGYLLNLIYVYMSLQKSIIYSDELTHLENRRSMIKSITDNMREGREWSYIISDVNSFKKVNDEYGHMVGDKALAFVALVLNEVALNHDATAYRYGGDEFVIISGTADEMHVRAICEEINKAFDAANGKKKFPFELSVSSGYAIYQKESKATIPDIMENADAMMYSVKNSYKMSQ